MVSDSESLSDALVPLAAIVGALSPNARVTALSLHGDVAEVVTSRGVRAPKPGELVRASTVSALSQRLLEEGSFVVGADDPTLSADLRESLAGFGFLSGFMGWLHTIGGVVECAGGERQVF